MAVVVVKVNNVDLTDLVIFADASFDSRVNGEPGSCEFRVRDDNNNLIFEAGQSITVDIDGEREWTGYLMQATSTYILPVSPLPPEVPRIWRITGVDINILFRRRIVVDPDDPTVMTGKTYKYTGTPTPDTTAIADLVTDFLDLTGDGLDVSTFVENVGDINVDQDANAFGASWTWEQAMASIAALPAAIYYLDPLRNLVYTDVDTVNAPFGLSDQPDGSTTFGYREPELLKDASNLINEYFAWGIGTGSNEPVFSRLEDIASVTTHGRWQGASITFDVYTQATVDRIADSWVNGSPSSRRGHKDDKIAFICTIFEPGIRAGMKVDVTSTVFDFNDVMPVRELRLSFATQTDPVYRLTLSHAIDAPWSFYQMFNPSIPRLAWDDQFTLINLGGPCDCVPPVSGTSIGGTHTITQNSAGTLEDSFGRTIPYVASPTTPGPNGLWYQYGSADTGQQWWHGWQPGSQAPPPPNSVEIDGTSVLLDYNVGSSPITAGQMNRASLGGFEFEYYDFGWKLPDLGFDVTMDFWFEQFSPLVSNFNQFALGVGLGQDSQSNVANFGQASVAYRIRRSTDVTQLFMRNGGSPNPATITIPALPSAQTWYRMRWQVTGQFGISRVKVWQVGNSEPSTWDGTTILAAPILANAFFSISNANSAGATSRMDNVHLEPLDETCYASICEDNVTQLGERQFQLRNPYVPKTITAFVDHAGYPLQYASASQSVPNIVEDDPSQGIFSFPASITYTPAYNPTITTGTDISACYIVPPGDNTCLCVCLDAACTAECALALIGGALTTGAIRASADGITWYPQLSGFSNSNSVGCFAWSPELGLFIAGSLTNAKLETSPNGVTWTARTSGFGTDPINTAVWSPELGIFVIAGGHGKIATSPDGITWTLQTTVFPTDSLADGAVGSAWSPELGLFVLVGNSVTSPGTNMATSPDGINWTLQTSGFGSNLLYDVEWAPALGMFVTCGGGGRIGTSSDGITWSVITGVLGSNSLRAVSWSSELALLVTVRESPGTDNNAATSPDAVTWTSRNTGFGASTVLEAEWSATLGLFLIGGASGKLATSPDGITWTLQTSGFGAATIRAIGIRPQPSNGDGVGTTNGTDTFDLGAPFWKGTSRVWLDGAARELGVDYTEDYDAGLIIFTSTPAAGLDVVATRVTRTPCGGGASRRLI